MALCLLVLVTYSLSLAYSSSKPDVSPVNDATTKTVVYVTKRESVPCPTTSTATKGPLIL